MLELTSVQRQYLESQISSRVIEKRQSDRARIILMYSSGINKSEISRRIGLHRNCVIEWINRFKKEGISGLLEKDGRGRPDKYSLDQVKKVVSKVCQKPPKGRDRWTIRLLAEKLNIDKDKVHRILQEHSLRPHRLGTFMFSPDPAFEDKLLEVIGLYMKPPKNALVLCIDEKTGIQALDRTQPLLPLKANKPRAWTNEYVRHGTRTLLAALNIQTGTVTAWVNKTRKTGDFIYFLDKVAKEYPNRRLHIVLDNLNIHKNKEIEKWIEAHPLVSFHYTPTHASWVNLIECFFSILTRQGLKQSVFRSVKELEKFLRQFIEEYNKSCGPFIWTKGPDKLKKIIELTLEYQQINV